METNPLNDQFEMTKEKVSRLCNEKKTEQAQEEWKVFLNSVIYHHSWDIIKNYSEACISQLPEYHIGYLSAGIACLNLQDYSTALTHFIKVLDLYPNHVIALKHKSETLYVMDQYEEALHCAEILRQTDLFNPEYIKLVSSNLDMLGRYEESLDLVEEGLRIHPENCNLMLEKAMGLNILGDRVGALEFYAKAEQLVRKNTLSPELISTLILLHLNRGGMLKNEIDASGGEDEQNLGFVLMELANAKTFENRTN